jgi:ABC-2 type transport system ATP-binding protein
MTATALTQRISGLPTVRQTEVVREDSGVAAVRAFPSGTCRNGELALSLSEIAAREGWKLEELHTEEGRLDEVFRNITLPDTKLETRK